MGLNVYGFVSAGGQVIQNIPFWVLFVLLHRCRLRAYNHNNNSIISYLIRSFNISVIVCAQQYTGIFLRADHYV
jgi:hypothetical protein